jgi:stress response protein SCP2
MAEAVRSLQPGERLATGAAAATVAIGWKAAARASILACLTDKANKVIGKNGLVATATPRVAGGAVALDSAGGSETRYSINLLAVPAGVEKIIFCAILDGGEATSVGRLGLSLVIGGSGGPIARFDLPDHAGQAATALIGEFYRLGDAWKFRAIGESPPNGAEGLARFLGCDPATMVEATGPAPPAPPAPAPPPPPPPPPSRAPAPPPVARETPGLSLARPVRTVSPPAAPADQFSCRGWALGAEGVGTPGAGGIGRELLDLRSDPKGRLWPAAFERDPMTGEALDPAPRLVLTNGHSLGDTGLPHLPAVSALDPASRQAETIPPGAQIFAAGGTPPRLVAVDAAAGKAWWKAPWKGSWIAIGRVPAGPQLPLHALGLAGSPEGVFFAAETALIHLLPEQQPVCSANSFDGTPVAAPAAVGAAIVLLLREAEGLSLLIRSPGGETQTIKVAAADEGWREEGPFGAAATDGETAFWVGQKGFVALEDTLEAPAAFWRRWPAKVEGLPFLRPYLAANGRFWAMCREIADDGAPGPALAAGMTVAGSREKRGLLGPHLSVGDRTYRDHDLYSTPWGDPVETVELGADYADCWMLPLLRLGNGSTVVGLVKDSARSGGSRGFVFREGELTLREVALALHRENRDLIMLNHVLRISSTDDIAIFVDADRLCIHHAESNTCASWSISF